MHQRDPATGKRTEAEAAAFHRALSRTMDVWYAHQQIVTLFVTRQPSWYTGRSYDLRGWTFFERSAAELIKPVKPYVKPSARPAEGGKEGSKEAALPGRWLWDMAIDSSAESAVLGRKPPLAPSAFAHALQTRKFTNDADAASVAHLYEGMATRVLGMTTQIKLDQARATVHVHEIWYPFPARYSPHLLLAQFLPHFNQAPVGEGAGVQLAEALQACLQKHP